MEKSNSNSKSKMKAKAKVITIGIQKGGASKTTSAGILAYLLGQEHKVLAVDLDSQGNLTELFTQRDIYDFHGYTVLEAMQEQNAKKYVQKVSDTIHLLTADDHLARFPAWLYEEYRGNRSLVLRETLKNVLDDYDFIILDTPPALGDATINALAASDAVVAMMEASKFCYSALGRFLETCVHVQELVNKDLKIAGILRTNIDVRRTDNKAFMELVVEEYGDLCFQTVITRTAAAGRLPIHGFAGNPELKAAVLQYRSFVEEMMERV